MRKSMMASVQSALALAARAEASANKARSPQTKALAEQARRIASAVQSLDELTRTRSPLDTMESHTIKVSQAAQRMKKSVELARGHFTTALMTGLKELYEQVSERTGIDMTGDTPRGAEIRAYVRSLPLQGRFDILNKAMDARDRETLTAL